MTLFRMMAAAMLAGLAFQPVSATIFTLNFTGTLSTDPNVANEQIDRLGLFGQVGQQMAGSPFSGTFRIDSNALFLVNVGVSNGPQQGYFNGLSPFSNRGEAITAQIRIAGRTIRNIGTSTNPFNTQTGTRSASLLAIGEDGGRDTININTQSDSNNSSMPLTLAGNTLLPSGLRVSGQVATFARDIVPPGFALQPFSLFTSDPGVSAGSSFVQVSVSSLMGGSTYYGVVDSVTLSQSAVPEPASWALLLAGFGLTGLMARRRNMVRMVAA